MHPPKVSEYTSVHVDDRLSNSVSVRSLVNVYSSQVVKNERPNISCKERKQEVLNIDKEFAQQEVVDTLSDNAVNQIHTSSKCKKEVNEGVESVNDKDSDCKKSCVVPFILENGNQTKLMLYVWN